MGTVGFEADRVEASVRFFAPESIWTRHHQTSCARAHACAAGAYDDDGALALHHLRAHGSVAVSGQDARAEDGRVDARRCAASGSARVMPMALHLSRRMHPITWHTIEIDVRYEPSGRSFSLSSLVGCSQASPLITWRRALAGPRSPGPPFRQGPWAKRRRSGTGALSVPAPLRPAAHRPTVMPMPGTLPSLGGFEFAAADT